MPQARAARRVLLARFTRLPQEIVQAAAQRGGLAAGNRKLRSHAARDRNHESRVHVRRSVHTQRHCKATHCSTALSCRFYASLTYVLLCRSLIFCFPSDIVRKSTGSYLQELQARVYGESLARASDAVETSAYVLANMETVGNDALTLLKFQRKQVQDAWSAYIAQSQERAKLEAAGKPLKSDPFLLCRVYESELHTLQTQEVKFSALMASLMRDLETHEVRRMAATKSTLLDNLLAQKAVLEHTVKFTDTALITIKAIDPAADVKEFAANAGLYLPPPAGAGRRSSNASASASASGGLGSTPAAPMSSSAANAAALASGASRADAPALLAHSQTELAVDAQAKDTPTIAFLQTPPVRDVNALGRVYAHEIEKEVTNNTHAHTCSHTPPLRSSSSFLFHRVRISLMTTFTLYEWNILLNQKNGKTCASCAFVVPSLNAW